MLCNRLSFPDSSGNLVSHNFPDPPAKPEDDKEVEAVIQDF